MVKTSAEDPAPARLKFDVNGLSVRQFYQRYISDRPGGFSEHLFFERVSRLE